MKNVLLTILHFGKNQKKVNRGGTLLGAKGDLAGILNALLWLPLY